MKFILNIALLTGLVACASHEKKQVMPANLKEAVSSDFRSPENKVRDVYRHPSETLEFFGLRPDMSVVEIWPSGGWYSEILAPYLAEQGKYIIADPASDPRGYTTKRKAWMARNPKIAEKVTHSVFMPEKSSEIAPANSVDMVLTFRNVHNWSNEAAKKEAFKVFFKALKPGGVLGVVEHRAPASKKLDPKSGYIKEADVIRYAKNAGFILAEKSEINANPKDKGNHPEGVWTLPPTLRMGDVQKVKYQAIGESDRMTLKFVKPLKK